MSRSVDTEGEHNDSRTVANCQPGGHARRRARRPPDFPDWLVGCFSLEQTAGRELARLLVKALAGDHRARLA